MTAVRTPEAEIAPVVRSVSRPWLLRHWHVPVAVAVLAVVYLNLRGHLPSGHAVVTALSSASVGWIVFAAGCQALSLGSFAYQQRSLLRALDVRMSVPRAMAVTYARTAIAFGLPAGAAVSAGFAFDQFRRSGATSDKAAAVTVLSAVVSILGLVSLCLAGVAGMFLLRPVATFDAHPIVLCTAAGMIVTAALAWLWFARAGTEIRSRRQESVRVRPVQGANKPGGEKFGGEQFGGEQFGGEKFGREDSQPVRVPDGRIARLVAALRRAVDAARTLGPRDLAVGAGFAAGSWLLDALCLAAVSAAFQLPVGLFTIFAMYLGIQIVLQLPVTPGGIGLIETGLLAGLTHAGSAVGAAAAVVVTYRVLSCWLILPLGGAAWLVLRRHRTPQSYQQLSQAR